jgi:hypothetical protein
MICLCFYADGPRADNLVRLPGFPDGVSYDRPFRYRDKWIEDDLLQQLRANPKALDGQEVLLGMRFIAEDHQDLIVPVRFGTCEAVSLSPDQNQVYFRVQRLVDFTGVADLDEIAEEVKDGADSATRGKLLFRFDMPRPAAVSSDESGDASWAKLTELIAKSATLPVHDDARQALFLRVQRPRSARRLTAKKVHHSWTEGDVYGFRLPERSAKELVILHRLPSLIGTNVPLTDRPEINIRETANTVVATPSSAEISANYDQHVVTIAADRRTGSWVQLKLTPSPTRVPAGNSELIGYEISLPLKVRLAPIYRLRTQILPILLVAGALFASSYYTANQASAHVDKRTHKVTSNTPYWPSLIASTVASLIIFVFRR